MENMSNVGLFAVHKIISECEESMRIWRTRKKPVRMFSYYTKSNKSVYISVNNNTNINFFIFFLPTLYGMDTA